MNSPRIDKASTTHPIAIGLLTVCASIATHAAEWSDTSLGYRWGTHFAEPYGATDITKSIVSLTYVGGYKYGSNFFNADMLFSNSKDPGDNTTSGAQEVYVVYRNTVDFSKVTGTPYKYGPIRSFGATGGFDVNSKNDSYGSKKQMFVLGPTLMFEVPGFLNLSVLAFRESNAPNGIDKRYYYKTHAAGEIDWGMPLPITSIPLSFEGYALWIASKGINEFGGPTAPETHIDAKVLADIGNLIGGAKNTLKIGFGYEYWHNKFGNPTTPVGQGAGPGATARTPMVRVEYHF